MKHDDYRCYRCDVQEKSNSLCERCNEIVCTDCMTPCTLQNQIDFCLCNSCNDDITEDAMHENELEWVMTQIENTK